ncbi:hypothetical protein JCM8202_004940 [Rhodotorula sphaerocarpa]
MPPSGVPSEPARLCTIASLLPAHRTQPPRVRFVGRVAALLPEAALAVLVDTDPTGQRTGSDSVPPVEAHAVVVDLTMPVLLAGAEPPSLKDRVMVMGEVTALSAPPPRLPDLQVLLPAPLQQPLDPLTVVTVERFDPCEDLDMEQWRAAVQAVEAVQTARRAQEAVERG